MAYLQCAASSPALCTSRHRTQKSTACRLADKSVSKVTLGHIAARSSSRRVRYNMRAESGKGGDERKDAGDSVKEAARSVNRDMEQIASSGADAAAEGVKSVNRDVRNIATSGADAAAEGVTSVNRDVRDIATSGADAAVDVNRDVGDLVSEVGEMAFGTVKNFADDRAKEVQSAMESTQVRYHGEDAPSKLSESGASNVDIAQQGGRTAAFGGTTKPAGEDTSEGVSDKSAAPSGGAKETSSDTPMLMDEYDREEFDAAKKQK